MGTDASPREILAQIPAAMAQSGQGNGAGPFEHSGLVPPGSFPLGPPVAHAISITPSFEPAVCDREGGSNGLAQMDAVEGDSAE